MTEDARIANIVNILSRDFTLLIGLDGLGLYVFLLRLEATNLGTFEIEKLTENLNMYPEDINNLLTKMKICGLIEYKLKNKDKYNYTLNPFKALSQPEKLHFLDLICENQLMNEEDAENVEYIITKAQNKTPKQEGEVTKKIKEKKPVQDIDILKKEKNINPDTGRALVRQYYHKLSNVFGMYCQTHNEYAEARLLNDSMRKYGDSPDRVRQMFEYIITDAKSKNMIEWVNHISKYLKFRDIAYYRLFVNPTNTNIKLAGPEQVDNNKEVDVKYIQEMYEHFLQIQMQSDIIIKDILTPQFGEKAVVEFMKTIGEKNV